MFSNGDLNMVETLKEYCGVTTLSEETRVCSGCKCNRRFEEFAMNLKTCIKCREKGKKMDASADRMKKHKARQKEMNAEYCQKYRDNIKKSSSSEQSTKK